MRCIPAFFQEKGVLSASVNLATKVGVVQVSPGGPSGESLAALLTANGLDAKGHAVQFWWALWRRAVCLGQLWVSFLTTESPGPPPAVNRLPLTVDCHLPNCCRLPPTVVRESSTAVVSEPPPAVSESPTAVTVRCGTINCRHQRPSVSQPAPASNQPL